MAPIQFFRHLAFITGGTGLLLAALHFLPTFSQHWPLSLLLLVVFPLVCIGLYYAGQSAVKSSNKVAFNGLVSGSVFGKMVLSLALLFIYQQNFHPTNQWFVGIFLLVYIVYTAFEVWFMTKLARS